MSYRCDICGIKVPPKTPRLVYRTFKRNSPDVAKELAVCEGCQSMLREVPLKSVKDPYYLRAKKGEKATVAVLAELPDRAPLPVELLGRMAKNVEL